jgi:PhzF family phenazine biosynthesis protein
MKRRFMQVDVFTETPYHGNALAVVVDGAGVPEQAMRALTRWTNLSETAFLLPPSDPRADYRVRIFTPSGADPMGTELPFAGHPTIGSCHAWLEAGGQPRRPDVVVQECPAGLVSLRRTGGGLAFAAPPLVRSGPVAPDLVRHVADVLRIDVTRIIDSAWVDNGPGWVAVLLGSADEVLALRPGFVDIDLGVVGPCPPGSPEAFEVRAFLPQNGATLEDPVTGSLNASLAGWLLGTGRAQSPYIARQGTALARQGRVHISQDADGTVWVGGHAITCISGQVDM